MSSMFVIKFDNGSYNYGVGEINGHESTLNEASQYTEHEVVERVPNLMGVIAIEAVNAEDLDRAAQLTLALVDL